MWVTFELSVDPALQLNTHNTFMYAARLLKEIELEVQPG